MTDHNVHEQGDHDHAGHINGGHGAAHNHPHHSSHAAHDHDGGHSDPEQHHHRAMLTDFNKRFYISFIVTIPILILSPMIQGFIGVDWQFPYDQYILFVLATFIFFYGGWPFITGAVSELKDKNPGMMTLIGLAILVA